ncbi:hypothetical protein RND71_005516 [Anisodus tanguticus]|uniref:Uncharacterized protein n=1 Tax=Anisodus tanguticus TaxID=243964 RepID=A0AAE1SS26_9SOLA|nr:hypothetical protein RND71_005516 [Anisodus tanguticus]
MARMRQQRLKNEAVEDVQIAFAGVPSKRSSDYTSSTFYAGPLGRLTKMFSLIMTKQQYSKVTKSLIGNTQRRNGLQKKGLKKCDAILDDKCSHAPWRCKRELKIERLGTGDCPDCRRKISYGLIATKQPRGRIVGPSSLLERIKSPESDTCPLDRIFDLNRVPSP